MRVIIILLATFLLGLQTQAQSLPNGHSKFLDSLLLQYRVPALCAAAITTDRITFGFAGKARHGYDQPVNASSKWHLGSCTKGITAFIACGLVERGLLEWDKKVLQVLPELRGKIRKEYKKIVFKDLLTHRSGVRSFTSGLDFLTVPALSGTVSEKRLQFTRYVLNLKPLPIGDTTVAYSNAGYIVAACMMEKVTGKTWETLVEEAFKRIGIGFFVGLPNSESATNPWGHSRIGLDSIISIPSETKLNLPDYMAPAGNISLTIQDYAAFVQLNLNGLVGIPDQLSTETFQEMHFGTQRYSLGWANTVFKSTNEKISTHDGTLGMYYCHTIIFPESKFAYIIMLNIMDSPPHQLLKVIGNQLLKEYSTKPSN